MENKMKLWKAIPLMLGLLIALGCLIYIGSCIGILLPLFLCGKLRDVWPAHIVYATSCLAAGIVSLGGLIVLKLLRKKWWFLGGLLFGIAIGAVGQFVSGWSTRWAFVYR